MKEMNMKSFLIVVIFLTSVFAMPMAATGYEKSVDDRLELSQVDVGIFDGFRGGFGALFGENMGYGGNILAAVFQMLFLQGLNLTAHEMLDNTFVLSANITKTFPGGNYDFALENDTREIVLAPLKYNVLVPAITGYSYAYCVIEKSGSFSYTIEQGAAVTLVIWDHDRSFITAVNKLINFFKKIIYYENILGREIPEDLIKEGISLVTWFLIHINDIFTGDELFILNPITWQKLDIIPETGFNIIKTWKVTGPSLNINPETDLNLADVSDGDTVLTAWQDMAIEEKDNYMQWLMTPTLEKIAETIWTQFSFDLIQLWVKNFEIHIDVSEILDAATNGGGEDPEVIMANAFKGCDVEFYLFTHHLAGAFLYNDTDSNRELTYDYININVEGTNITRPVLSEITHRLVLGTVGSFNFMKPVIDKSNKSVSWGLNVMDVNISAVPLGVDLQSYIGAPQENLDYIHFGFTFEPRTDSELNAGHGLVKLNQFFAPWNNPNSPYANSLIEGLDLAILYVSTVLHFHLNIATQGQVPQDPQQLLEHRHYKNATHELMIGNYLGRGTQEEIEFVDIAGPQYEYGTELVKGTASAETSLIPIALWTFEMEQHDDFVIAGGESVDTYSSDIMISVEFNVLLWAVCYPEFENGSGIWHDPTFSVYLIFESKEFWALVVLIAGVGLVGVATILIKRRKDMRI